MKYVQTGVLAIFLLFGNFVLGAGPFDGKWEGVLITNEKCKGGTIQFDVQANSITSGFIEGPTPDGRVNRGSITSVEPVGSDGNMKILIGNKSPGTLTFSDKTFEGVFGTRNCGDARRAKGERKR